MLNPTRLLVLGDVHGSTLHIQFALRMARKNRCEAILQVGDFGYWAHTEGGRHFLNYVVQEAEKYGIPIIFLDGNHENFDMLWNEDFLVTDDGFVKVWENSDWLLYSPRGHRFNWTGRSLMTFGGAFSIDKGWRLDHGGYLTSWWPQETITMGDVYKMAEKDDSPVDILFSHDYPCLVDFPTRMYNIPESYENRKMLQHVVDIVKPKKLYHGHMHHQYTAFLETEEYTTRIVGLGHDEQMKNSYAICDLEKDNLEWKPN